MNVLRHGGGTKESLSLSPLHGIKKVTVLTFMICYLLIERNNDSSETEILRIITDLVTFLLIRKTP